MASWYGGIYRHPPKPQRQRPSAILPAEVFPDPPLGNRGRQIVMAIVAAQWIWVPQPVQRPPVVTEGAAPVVEHVPYSRLSQNTTVLDQWAYVPEPFQRPARHILPAEVFPDPSVGDQVRRYQRVILASWETIPQPQRFRPTAILPAEVFDNPPIETRRLSTDMQVVASWLPDPLPQPLLPRVTEEEVGFVPFTREQVVVGLWRPVPAPLQRPARAILPAEVFPDPPLGAQDSLYEWLVVELWREAPQPQQRRPAVTEGVVGALVPYVRDRIVIGLWKPLPVPQQRGPTATLPAEVFPDPPLGQQWRQIIHDLVRAQWVHVPEPQQPRPTVTEGIAPPAVDDPPPYSRVQDRLILALWEPGPGPRQRLPVVTESGVAPTVGKGRPVVTFIDRQVVLLWAELRVPESSITATGLEPLPPGITAPAEPVPLVLSGARARVPRVPTPILVSGSTAVLLRAELQAPAPDAAAAIIWAQWHVPDLPLELTPDEILALGIILDE